MLWCSYAHGMTPVVRNQITHEFKDHQASYLDIDVGLTNVYFPYGSNPKNLFLCRMVNSFPIFVCLSAIVLIRNTPLFLIADFRLPISN